VATAASSAGPGHAAGLAVGAPADNSSRVQPGAGGTAVSASLQVPAPTTTPTQLPAIHLLRGQGSGGGNGLV
jgi:hypothetical protein